MFSVFGSPCDECGKNVVPVEKLLNVGGAGIPRGIVNRHDYSNGSFSICDTCKFIHPSRWKNVQISPDYHDLVRKWLGVPEAMQVISSEKLFTRFQYLSTKVEHLGSIVQNDIDITTEQFAEWSAIAQNTIRELEQAVAETRVYLEAKEKPTS